MWNVFYSIYWENYLNKCLHIHLLDLNFCYLCVTTTEFNFLFIICVSATENYKSGIFSFCLLDKFSTTR